MTITHDFDNRNDIERLCYTRMQLKDALKVIDELMKVTRNYKGITQEEDQLWIIRGELQTALARVDELIKRKQWESKQSSKT